MLSAKTGKITRSPAGITVLEVLVTLSIAAVVFAGITTQYSGGVKMSYDQNVRIATNLQVQAILQTIGSEIRILGNGVPFDQANFQIGEDTLLNPTVTEPILIADSTSTKISFRLNESGHIYLLTQDFNPDVSLDIFLTEVNDLDVNDPIYISNSVMSGDDGFYGVIAGVDQGANKITLSENFERSPGAIFVMGSTFEEVPVVTFESPVDNSGIVRDSGFGPVLMGPHSSMTLEYLDINGNQVALPLTWASLTSQLRTIRVTISMRSNKPLTNGSYYIGSAAQSFGIRNLVYVF